MGEKDVVEAIRKHINGQNNDWKFMYGRETIGKTDFLSRLNNDSKFRKHVVNLVYSLSIDILTRKSHG